ncbi:MAG: hypothetical protein AAF512_02170, partial [Pseudomonadota bacterium]
MNKILQITFPLIFILSAHAVFAQDTGDVKNEEEGDFFSRVIDSTEKVIDGLTGDSEETPVDDFPQVWQGTYEKLDDILILQDKHEDLPDSSWFKEDKASNQEKIDALMQTAIDILGISNARTNLQSIKEYQQKIREARNQIGKYQADKIGKPSDASDYDKKIANTRKSISQYEAAITEKKMEIAQEMRAMGLTMDVEQLEALMASVNGDDMVEMSIVFNNVNSVSNQLSDLMAANSENTEFARKHY